MIKVDKEFIEYVEQIEQKLQYSLTNNLSNNEFETMKFDIVQCFASIKEIIKEQKLNIITREFTFEDVRKIANENGFELNQYQESTTYKKKIYYEINNLDKSLPKLNLRRTFNTLQEVINYFSPF